MITASVTGSPRKSEAVSRILASTMADTSCGERLWSSMHTRASPFSAASILNGAMEAKALTSSLSNLRPISRLTAKTVFSGLVTAWRLAI